jgi:hypothetical protein
MDLMKHVCDGRLEAVRSFGLNNWFRVPRYDLFPVFPAKRWIVIFFGYEGCDLAQKVLPVGASNGHFDSS